MRKKTDKELKSLIFDNLNNNFKIFLELLKITIEDTRRIIEILNIKLDKLVEYKTKQQLMLYIDCWVRNQNN
jgi:hypothetical protein